MIFVQRKEQHFTGTSQGWPNKSRRQLYIRCPSNFPFSQASHIISFGINDIKWVCPGCHWAGYSRLRNHLRRRGRKWHQDCLSSGHGTQLRRWLEPPKTCLLLPLGAGATFLKQFLLIYIMLQCYLTQRVLRKNGERKSGAPSASTIPQLPSKVDLSVSKCKIAKPRGQYLTLRDLVSLLPPAAKALNDVKANPKSFTGTPKDCKLLSTATSHDDHWPLDSPKMTGRYDLYLLKHKNSKSVKGAPLNLNRAELRLRHS